MARYADADIDRVRERADIIEVVTEHVRLKRTGRSHVGLCPFHQEKTPSFNVDPDKGLYFCHGCSAGGDVFTFVREIDGLTFPEAVETLASRYGIELTEVTGGQKQASPRSRLLQLHVEAVELYEKMLSSTDGAPVREYLASRGFDPDASARHRVGFGGWKRAGLVRTLARKGYSSEELVAAGLGTKGRGGLRDTFSGRVLFPIFDPSDRPIAFGGRVLPEEYRRDGAPDGPKYLNSRESTIFRKSKVLYGANWARGDVVQSRRLVLVEGYTDVMALHAAGVTEAVATCGTSLTEDHMREISTRFGDVKVILCLDADAAGIGAMSRSRTEELAESYAPGARVKGGTWLPVGRGWLPEVYVATLRMGMDPADFVRAEGAEGLEKVLTDAVPLVRFLLTSALEGADLRSPEGRAAAVRKGAEILGQVGDSVLRHEYTLWLADRVGIEPFEVNKVVAQKSGTDTRGPALRNPPAKSLTLSGHQRVEREALRALATCVEAFDDESLIPDEQAFTLPVHRSVFRLLIADREENGKVDPSRVAGRAADDDVRNTVSEIAMGEVPDERTMREVLVRLQSFALSRQIDDRKERLRSLDPEREAEAYDALFEELLELEARRRELTRRSA